MPTDVSARPLTGCYGNAGSDFQYLIDYGGYRYHIALLYNGNADRNVVENVTLQKLYDAFDSDDDDEMEKVVWECEDLLYPFMKADYEARSKGLTTAIPASTDGVVKLKAWTVDGVFQVATHDLHMEYPPNPPVDNTFSDVAVFQSSEVEQINEVVMDIFKVKNNDSLYCLKSVHRNPNESFIREVSRLTVCLHPNITHLVGVTVNTDGKVDGMLTDWIENARPLSEIETVSAKEATKWIGQIKDAISYIHQKGLVWGDAKAANILVSMDGDVILVDFGGGFTDGWVEQRFCNTVKGDLQGLGRIVAFINGKIR